MASGRCYNLSALYRNMSSNNLSRKGAKNIKGKCHSTNASLGPVRSVYAESRISGPAVVMADFLIGGPKPLRNFSKSGFEKCNTHPKHTSGSKKRSTRRRRRYTRRN